MAVWNELTRVFERSLAPARPDLPAIVAREGELDILVVFTSEAATLLALKTANTLAAKLHARITMIALQLVPYPAPLTCPPVLVDFAENRFRSFAAASQVETMVQIYLCRDRWEGLKAMLKPRSLVVVGARRRWWPTRDMRLAAKLRRAGHEVVIAELE